MPVAKLEVCNITLLYNKDVELRKPHDVIANASGFSESGKPIKAYSMYSLRINSL